MERWPPFLVPKYRYWGLIKWICRMTDIVKVQVPLIANDPAGEALVYAKGRKKMVQQRLDYTTKKLMGTDLKAFFEAEYHHATGKWTIGKRVKDRDW